MYKRLFATLFVLLVGTPMAAAQTDAGSYVALDAKGKPTQPKTGTQPHACVRDTTTGLVWEVKTDDRGPSSKRWTYSWYDKSKAEERMPVGYADGGSCPHKGSCDTTGVVIAANKRKLCGFTDWRLPSSKELAGLLRPDQPKKIDERFFPNSLADYYWTGTYVALEVGGAMFISFEHGYELVGNSAAAAAVRLVRGPVQP